MIYLWHKIGSNMKKNHWSEFQRVKQQMRGFLFGAIISIISYVVLNIKNHQIEGAFDLLRVYKC